MAEPVGADSGVIAMVIAAGSLVVSFVTGRRQDKRETEEQIRARDHARREEIREVAVRAVEDSARFVLAASQNEVNARLLDAVSETRAAVTGVSEKLDTLLLNDRLHIRKDRG